LTIYLVNQNSLPTFETSLTKTTNKIMYYEERWISGILHYRHTPNGEWIRLTKEMLVKRLAEFKTELSQLLQKYNAEIWCDVDGDTYNLEYSMEVTFGTWNDFKLAEQSNVLNSSILLK
jgi:hypothetical protein